MTRKTKDKILRDAVDLAHGAVDLTVTSSQGLGSRIAGATIYTKRKVSHLAVPSGDNAYNRTIRYHESIHAQRQKAATKKTQTLAHQCILDVRVHTVDWPVGTPKSTNRDALATALMDCRNALNARNLAMTDNAVWNQNLTPLIRAVAIALKCDTEVWQGKYTKRIHKTISKYAGVDFLNCLVEIVNHGMSGPKGQETAREMYNLLLRREEDTPNNDNGKTKEGTTKDTSFAIVDLPHTVPCDPTAQRIRLTRSGAHLNPSRLVACILNNTTSGLFRKINRQLGGTVLIDASGSMDANNENLSELCKLAPGATVGYYSGCASKGVLVIFAKDGARYDCSARLPHMFRGNAVDYQALQWLLSNEAPRVMITDRGFCGGKEGYALAALALLSRCEASGEVKVITSIDEAIGTFKMQGK